MIRSHVLYPAELTVLNSLYVYCYVNQ